MPDNMEAKIREIEINMARQDERICYLTECYKEQGELIREIKEAISVVKDSVASFKTVMVELNAEKPSWSVAIALTILSSLVVGMGVYLSQVV